MHFIAASCVSFQWERHIWFLAESIKFQICPIVCLYYIHTWRILYNVQCSHLEDLVQCSHLEDLAEPGVEVVRVCWHSPFQVWRLEGDVLEGQGWRDRVENLEKGQKFKLFSKLKFSPFSSFITCSGLMLPASKAAT